MKVTRNISGFTLIEILIATAIFGVLISVAVSSFGSGFLLNKQSEIRSGGITVAQEVLENLRSVSSASLPSSGQDLPKTVVKQGVTYTYILKYCEDSNKCPGSARQIKIEVSSDNKPIYNAETIFTSL